MSVFEYSVLRVLPDVERGESMNVGVLVWCQDQDVLAVGVDVDRDRLVALAPSVELEAVCAAVDGVKEAADGLGSSAAMSKGQRFRWLTAPRSTVVQPGPVHAGLTDDPVAEVERLLDRLVRSRR